MLCLVADKIKRCQDNVLNFFKLPTLPIVHVTFLILAEIMIAATQFNKATCFADKIRKFPKKRYCPWKSYKLFKN